MKTSEKIIKRLYNMGLINTLTPIVHSYHGSRNGSWSWVVSCGSQDIGLCYSMKECLSWKRWVYSKSLHEIFKYVDNVSASLQDDIIED